LMSEGNDIGQFGSHIPIFGFAIAIFMLIAFVSALVISSKESTESNR
jgi:hypothetical protein